MDKASEPQFQLPDAGLNSLPTGSVKDVANQMGRLIAAGTFATGERLPMEVELEARFNVSRTVIREVIKVLSGKGMVLTARRYGSRVRPFDEWHLLDPDVILWHGPDTPMASRLYRESAQLRYFVEPGAASLAARNASPEQKRLIRDAARAIHPDPHGIDAMIAADYTFHATILEASGNMMLTQFQGIILALLKFSYPAGALVEPDFDRSRENHINLAEAIEAGKPARARKIMEQMLKVNAQVAAALDALSSG